MHALRRIHGALVPEGILVDVHPIPPPATVEAGGRVLGRLEGDEFLATVRDVEERLEETVREGLFAHEARVEFDSLERFDTGPEAVERVEREWEGYAMPPALARRARDAPPPVDLREHVVCRRLRRI